MRLIQRFFLPYWYNPVMMVLAITSIIITIHNHFCSDPPDPVIIVAPAPLEESSSLNIGVDTDIIASVPQVAQCGRYLHFGERCYLSEMDEVIVVGSHGLDAVEADRLWASDGVFTIDFDDRTYIIQLKMSSEENQWEFIDITGFWRPAGKYEKCQDGMTVEPGRFCVTEGNWRFYVTKQSRLVLQWENGSVRTFKDPLDVVAVSWDLENIARTNTFQAYAQDGSWHIVAANSWQDKGVCYTGLSLEPGQYCKWGTQLFGVSVAASVEINDEIEGNTTVVGYGQIERCNGEIRWRLEEKIVIPDLFVAERENSNEPSSQWTITDCALALGKDCKNPSRICDAPNFEQSKYFKEIE